MSMIHYLDLDMVPGGTRAVCRLNQYDTDFEIRIALKASVGTLSIPTGTTVAIRGTKSDGNGYSAAASIDINTRVVTVAGDEQLSVVAGQSTYELTLYHGGEEINTANFYIDVERAALDKDTPTSKSQTRELVDIEDNAEELIAEFRKAVAAKNDIEILAEQAAASAEQAAADAEQTTADRAEVTRQLNNALYEVNEKADMIRRVTTSAEETASRALAAATNAENGVADVEADVDTLKRARISMNLEIGTKVDDAYVENGYLYLMANGEVAAGPLGPFSGGGGGGGGSSGNTAVLSVTNETGWLSKTIADGDDCYIFLSWSSLEDEMPTGNGTMRVSVNGVNKATMDIRQGQVSVNLGSFVSVGSNLVKVTVSDVYSNSRTINFTIESVTLSLDSSFDSSVAYTGPITFPFTPTGAVQKTVYFVMDGETIGTTVTSVSGRQMSFAIPVQSHGVHVLRCYFTCEINGTVVTSNELYYEIICLETFNEQPIIASSFNMATATQYTTINVDYLVYSPASMTTPIGIYVNDELYSEVTVDRTRHIFAYRADEVGELRIRFATGFVRKEITLQITASDVDVHAETDALRLHLSSAGRSNGEAHPENWTDDENLIAANLTDFNFVSDGWQLDADGVTVLRVSGDARVTIPYEIFRGDLRSTGKTIEVEFATRDVRNYDAAIFSCVYDGRGISLTAQKGELKSEQSEISMQYKENEHVRLAFVVEKSSENRLLYCYVNGIMSGVVQYPANDDFEQTIPVGISIGSNDCTIDLYRIRVYDNDLTRHQMLDNWIADTQDVTSMLERYTRNQVYDSYGQIVISRLPGDLPYMIIACDELPQYKGDKKTCSVTFVDPVNPARSFTAFNVQIDVQGTSSQYYARKNYKLKFNNGFIMTVSGATQEKFALRDGAIPTKTFCMKADVASSEGANNVELVRLYNDACPYKTPAQRSDERVRQGIDGFPCVIFWYDSGNDKTQFLGKYNFNNDKGTDEVYGFTQGDESWEVLNNTSDRVIFKSDDYTGTDWLNDFEARYPDITPPYTDPAQLAEFAAWVVSADPEKATGSALPSAVTIDGVSYDHDTAAYRSAKFKAELGNYVELQSCLFYYLFTEAFLMVDSRAKNMFPSFMGDAVVGG